MRSITVGWREEPFDCEFHGDGQQRWLSVFNQNELILREPVECVRTAYRRARELRDILTRRPANTA